MPMHRKNSASNQVHGEINASWFDRNVARQRRRNWVALKSRRVNRRKAKGK